MYQALYRKWRPKLFDDVVGQGHITQTLKKQVMTGRLSHAYLFTGTRGTGKTTCAKIMAKAVNCEHPVEGNPCGKCPACLGIDSGSILDVVELDAASNNGVDQVRALRDEAVYSPAAVKKRVYIVDEVHMLSVAAFNALLKILEEPPEHLMFILATTELHKVPATILSRCQRFSFQRIQPADIQNRLLYIAQNEGIDLTADGAALLARLADGALRDALSLLDQCAISGRKVDKEAVLDALGLAGNLRTAHLMDDIRRGKTAEALTELSSLYAAGKDVSAVLDELAALTRDLLLRQTAGDNSGALMAGGYDEATLSALEKGLSAQRLLHMLTLLQDTLSGLKTSTNRKTDAELCLIRLCDRRLDGSVLSLSERISKIEAAMAGGAPVPVAAISTAQEASQPPFVPQSPEEELTPAPLPQIEPPLPAEEPPEQEGIPALPPQEEAPPWDSPPEPVRPTPEPVTKPVQTPLVKPQKQRVRRTSTNQTSRAAGADVPAGDPNFWNELAPHLKNVVEHGLFGFIRQRMVSGSYENGTLYLFVLDEFIQKRLMMEVNRQPLEEAASAKAGRPVHIQVRVGNPTAAQQKTGTAPQQSAPAASRTKPEAQELPPLPEPLPELEPAPLPVEPPVSQNLPVDDPMAELLAFAEGAGKGIVTVE